jgi:hypothetical protein
MIWLRRHANGDEHGCAQLDRARWCDSLLPAFTESLPRVLHKHPCTSAFWSNGVRIQAAWVNHTAQLYSRRVPHVMPRSGLLTPIGQLALYTLCCVFSACSVYDSELIGSSDQGVGSVPAAGTNAAGGGGRSGDSADAGDPDGSADGPDGSLPMSPIPIDVHCGDGRVTGDEKCDIGVPDGMPGSCPKECPELAKCNPRKLNNSGCQAECVVLQLVCMSGDDCCPGNCTDKNDSDCSSSCGDGVVQTDKGETCESESNMPCKMSDAECDDGDPCTLDKLIGSAKNCNALCTPSKITTPKNDDACCPAGADANVDNDCKPMCGNKIRETGEDCDGTTGCSASCKLTLQPDQIACLEKFGTMSDECARCSCMNCASSYLACRGGADAKVNDLCNGVLECARTNDCFGSACYCGDALLCSPPGGVCKTAIEAAAGSTDQAMVSDAANNTMTTLGKAYTADTCRYQQCRQQCR